VRNQSLPLRDVKPGQVILHGCQGHFFVRDNPKDPDRPILEPAMNNDGTFVIDDIRRNTSLNGAISVVLIK